MSNSSGTAMCKITFIAGTKTGHLLHLVDDDPKALL